MRLARKILWMIVLLAILILFSKTHVEFVYRAF